MRAPRSFQCLPRGNLSHEKALYDEDGWESSLRALLRTRSKRVGWSPRSSPEKASGTPELFPTSQRAGLRIFTLDFLYGGLACAPHLRTSENGCLPGVKTSSSPASGPLSRLASPVPFPSRLTPLSSGPAGRNRAATGLES